MRLGKICIEVGYVVDLDNETMVNAAKECIVDDIDRALHTNILSGWVKTIENDADLKESDIAGFLIED